jgi:hypothetical protein
MKELVLNLARANESTDTSIKAMEEVLEEVFCIPGKELVLSLLKENYDLEKEEILEKPEVFQKMLKDFFGNSGTIIESMIIRKLNEKR